MADALIVNNRQVSEAMNAVRRMINDLDSDQPVIQDHTLRELLINEFVMVSHEAGWDPRTPTRPTTGTSVLSYSLAAGAYQTTLEGSGDIVAASEVYIDRSRDPLQFVPRRELEGWVNQDTFQGGAIQRGTPRYWSIELLASNVAATTSEMKNRLLVYPAADVATTVYWPRTIVDIGFVEPSGTGRSPFSYQLTMAWQSKSASQCIRMATDDGLKILQMDRGAADMFYADYQAAMEREKGERAMHVRLDFVREMMA